MGSPPKKRKTFLDHENNPENLRQRITLFLRVKNQGFL